MFRKKKVLAIALSLACLLAVGGGSVYAMAQGENEEILNSISTVNLLVENTDEQDTTAKKNFPEEDTTEEVIILSMINDDGSTQYSTDEGKTWNEGEPYSDLSTMKWEVLTEESLLKEIEQLKKDLADPDFMRNWTETMGRTEQDLVDLISDYEQDIERIKNGEVLRRAMIENADGTEDILIEDSIDESLIVSGQGFNVTYVDEETGEEICYEGETPEELRAAVEKSYADGEITKENRDEMLAIIK